MRNIIRISAIILFTFFVYSCSQDSESNADPSIPNKQLTGSSANDFLSEAKYKSLVIQLIYVEGLKPTNAALSGFVNFIQERTHKSDGIRIVEKAIPSPGKSEWTVKQVSEIEDMYRDVYNNGSELTLSLLCLDGKSDQDTGSSAVLGIAYRNTSFVVFEETVHGFSDQLIEPRRDILESTVIFHEFCHLLGLVNFGTAMVQDHQDQAHGKHCITENCLMSYEAEADILKLASSQVPLLDDQCLADLKANGGK